MAHRRCKDCLWRFPLDTAHFHRYRAKSGNLIFRGVCKDCANVRSRVWYEFDRERIKARVRRYHHANLEKRHAYQKKWTAANPTYPARRYQRSRAKILANNKRWRDAHQDQFRSGIKRWQLANPDKVRAQQKRRFHARRARLRKAAGDLRSKDIITIYGAQNGQCAYCGSALNGHYHVDHKTPLARGGSNQPSNACCACATCNIRKGTMTAEEFMEMSRGP